MTKIRVQTKCSHKNALVWPRPKTCLGCNVPNKIFVSLEENRSSRPDKFPEQYTMNWCPK